MSILVPPDQAGQRLDRVLASLLPDLSRSRLETLIDQGAVTRGGATIKDANHRVKGGETYDIAVPDAVPATPRGQDIPLIVVYEDKDLIVIDKPAGLVVHPAAGNPDGTLVNALIAHCGESLMGIGGELRPGIVHRLDKDTSGLLVAAKTERAIASLAKQFANPRTAASTTEAVQSSTIGLLREQYAAAAQREANLTAELGPQHPYVVESHAQVRNAQRLVTEEVARVADATRSEYERALANEEALTNNLDALKQRAIATGMAFVKLRELEREVEASRAVYESFLVRARETREQERLDTVNVRVLSDAQAPLDRSWPPRRLLLLLAALAGGLMAGLGLAYAAEQIGRGARPTAQAAPQMARVA